MGELAVSALQYVFQITRLKRLGRVDSVMTLRNIAPHPVFLLVSIKNKNRNVFQFALVEQVHNRKVSPVAYMENWSHDDFTGLGPQQLLFLEFNKDLFLLLIGNSICSFHVLSDDLRSEETTTGSEHGQWTEIVVPEYFFGVIDGVFIFLDGLNLIFWQFWLARQSTGTHKDEPAYDAFRILTNRVLCSNIAAEAVANDGTALVPNKLPIATLDHPSLCARDKIVVRKLWSVDDFGVKSWTAGAAHSQKVNQSYVEVSL